MGSAKNVNIIVKPTLTNTGKATFTFKDTYSVDDLVAGYGIKLPDEIPGKGIALWRMSDYTFKELIPTRLTHYIKSYVLKEGLPINSEKSRKRNVMLVDAANVFTEHKPIAEPIPGPKITLDFEYDIHVGAQNYVIPLEVIGRNELGSDSSIMKMYKNKEITPQDIGLEAISEDGTLPHPIVTYTTKYEKGDKFLTRKQAIKLSGLDEAQFNRLEESDITVNRALNGHTEHVAAHYGVDLRHPDGKREWIYYHGVLIVGDCCGTLDEDRFEIHFNDGEILKLSKQVARDGMRKMSWYKNDFLPWKAEVDPLIAKGVPREDWPKIRDADPLLKELLEYLVKIYDVGSRMWTLEAEKAEVDTLCSDFRQLRKDSII